MASSQGISALLEAEREAQKIVQKARDYRASRIKDARTEAAKEVEAYKSQKDSDYKQETQQHSGDSSTTQTEIDSSTQEQIDALNAAFAQNKDKVVSLLLEKLVQIQPQLHQNFKK